MAGTGGSVRQSTLSSVAISFIIIAVLHLMHWVGFVADVDRSIMVAILFFAVLGANR